MLGGDTDSFDPRTWARAGTPPPHPEPERPEPERTALRPARGRGPALPWAASAAVLLVGAGFAWVGRAPAAAPVAPTIAASEPVANASRRTLVVAGPDAIGPALAGSGVAAPVVAEVDRLARAALGTAPGDIRMEFDLVEDGAGQRLTRLVAAREDGAGVTLTARPEGGFAQAVDAAQLRTELRVVRGEMDATSFYNAAVNAGVTDSLVSAFAAAFAFDFDFQREIRPGDIFEAGFEQKVNAQGTAVGAPVLVYAALSTAAKSRALYRFLAPGETEPGWFDGNGHSVVRALMRTPVDGARISSNFGMRIHPVLGFQKMHGGTDFAAPIGTPIYAAGDGTVEWAAMKGPNGNLTILRHDNGWQTYYLHQNRFMPGIQPGARVRQGQEIGEIGTTGRSTGPHLHYEVHIDGEKVDPMHIDVGTGRTLGGSALAAFRKERDRIDTSRAAAG